MRYSNLVGGAIGGTAALAGSALVGAGLASGVGVAVVAATLAGACAGRIMTNRVADSVGESVERQVQSSIIGNNPHSLFAPLRRSTGQFLGKRMGTLVTNTFDRIDRGDIPKGKVTHSLAKIVTNKLHDKVRLDNMIEKGLKENHYPPLFRRKLAEKVVSVIENQGIPSLLEDSGISRVAETSMIAGHTVSEAMAMGYFSI